MNTTSELQNPSIHERQSAVLATLAVNPAAYLDISETLMPEMFPPGMMRDAAAHIWECQGKGLGYDTASIRAACGELGGAFTALLSYATRRDALAGHAHAVREGWIAVQSADAFRRYIAQSNTPEAMDALNLALKEVDTIKQATAGGKDRRGELFSAVFSDVYNSQATGMSGIPSPWLGFDAFTAGWQPGNLIYVAARPSMGKTTVMCEYALSAGEAGKRVAFFSMGDLTAKQLYLKMASMMSGVSAFDIRTGNIDEHRSKLLGQAVEQLHDLPIHVFDMRDVPNRIGRVCDRVRLEVERYDCSLAILDYVQQMRGDGNRYNTRNSEIEEISQGLKHTATRMDIPFVVGSQLSRAPEQRGGSKRPQMSDLRDSGSLEQDADHIQMLYRPAYYGIKEDDMGASTIGLTEIEIVKDRMAGERIPITFKVRMQAGRLVEDGSMFPAALPQQETPQLGPIAPRGRAADDDDIPF